MGRAGDHLHRVASQPLASLWSSESNARKSPKNWSVPDLSCILPKADPLQFRLFGKANNR